MISVGGDDVIEFLAKELGFKIEKLSVKYPGLPIGVSSRSISIWDSVLEKMQMN